MSFALKPPHRSESSASDLSDQDQGSYDSSIRLARSNSDSKVSIDLSIPIPRESILKNRTQGSAVTSSESNTLSNEVVPALSNRNDTKESNLSTFFAPTQPKITFKEPTYRNPYRSRINNASPLDFKMDATNNESIFLADIQENNCMSYEESNTLFSNLSRSTGMNYGEVEEDHDWCADSMAVELSSVDSVAVNEFRGCGISKAGKESITSAQGSSMSAVLNSVEVVKGSGNSINSSNNSTNNGSVVRNGFMALADAVHASDWLQKASESAHAHSFFNSMLGMLPHQDGDGFDSDRSIATSLFVEVASLDEDGSYIGYGASCNEQHNEEEYEDEHSLSFKGTVEGPSTPLEPFGPHQKGNESDDSTIFAGYARGTGSVSGGSSNASIRARVGGDGSSVRSGLTVEGFDGFPQGDPQALFRQRRRKMRGTSSFSSKEGHINGFALSMKSQNGKRKRNEQFISNEMMSIWRRRKYASTQQHSSRNKFGMGIGTQSCNGIECREPLKFFSMEQPLPVTNAHTFSSPVIPTDIEFAPPLPVIHFRGPTVQEQSTPMVSSATTATVAEDGYDGASEYAGQNETDGDLDNDNRESDNSSSHSSRRRRAIALGPLPDLPGMMDCSPQEELCEPNILSSESFSYCASMNGSCNTLNAVCDLREAHEAGELGGNKRRIRRRKGDKMEPYSGEKKFDRS